MGGEGAETVWIDDASKKFGREGKAREKMIA